MTTRDRNNRFKTWSLGVATLALAAVLSGCGSDSSSDAKNDSVNTVQPEGSWTLVRWIKSRTDSQAGNGQAQERRWKFAPTCKEGKCDINITPDGANGTYLPEGYTPAAGASASIPGTLKFNAATGVYEVTSPATKSSCTTTSGTIVQDAYEFTSSTSLKFTPAADGKKASLSGTYTETAKGIGPGIEAKCTDYGATFAVAASPTTAFDKADATDLSGKYTVTEVVESTEPATDRPAGFAGVLVPTSTIEKSGSAYKLGGVIPTAAEVVPDATGFRGTTTATSTCSGASGEIKDGLTNTEEWSQVRAVATSDDGKPVLTGRWNFKSVPTAAGAAANCAGTTNKDYVIFVPQSAI